MLDIFDFEIKVATLSGVLRLPVLTKAEHDKMTVTEDDGERSAWFVMFCKAHGVKIDKRMAKAEAARAYMAYKTQIDMFIDKNKELLIVPHSVLMDVKGGKRSRWPQKTTDLKIVYDHTGIDFERLENLNYLQYRFLLAEAVKYNMSGRDEGIEMLNAAYEEQCEPFDRKKFLSGG